MNYSKPCIEKNQVQFIVHLVVEDQIYDSVSDAQATFANAAGRFPGHVKSFVHQVDCDKIGSIALIAVHSFDTADNLVRWLQSDVRRRSGEFTRVLTKNPLGQRKRAIPTSEKQD